MAMPGSVKYPGSGVSVTTLELGALGGSWPRVFPANAPSTPAKSVICSILPFRKRECMRKRLTVAARILFEFTDTSPHTCLLIEQTVHTFLSRPRRRIFSLFVDGKVRRWIYFQQILDE